MKPPATHRFVRLLLILFSITLFALTVGLLFMLSGQASIVGFSIILGGVLVGSIMRFWNRPTKWER